jgi:hypothetical protein
MAVEYSADAPGVALLEFVELVEQAEAAAEAGDWKQVGTLNIVFHQRLVELSGSERISAFFRVVDAELRLAFALVEPADLYTPFIPRNRKIAELLLIGDRKAAAAEPGRTRRGRADDRRKRQRRVDLAPGRLPAEPVCADTRQLLASNQSHVQQSPVPIRTGVRAREKPRKDG